MKQQTKFIALAMSLMAILLLVACSGGSTTTNKTPTKNSEPAKQERVVQNEKEYLIDDLYYTVHFKCSYNSKLVKEGENHKLIGDKFSLYVANPQAYDASAADWTKLADMMKKDFQGVGDLDENKVEEVEVNGVKAYLVKTVHKDVANYDFAYNYYIYIDEEVYLPTVFYFDDGLTEKDIEKLEEFQDVLNTIEVTTQTMRDKK